MTWVSWFGRWGERDKALERLSAARAEYGKHGDRVIRLSRRTDIARKSAGSTLRAFDFVEAAFVKVTQTYADINDRIESIELGLQKGKVGDLDGLDRTLKGLGPAMDELEQHLSAWEARWEQVPLQLDDTRSRLAELKAQADSAAAAAGVPLPLTERLARLHEHLEKAARTLAEGNPHEAGHLNEDLKLAMKKVGEEVGTYVSAAYAVTQAEQDVAALRTRLDAAADAAPAAVGAVAAAEAHIARLRPALAGGKLEAFQHDHAELQKQLSAARSVMPR